MPAPRRTGAKKDFQPAPWRKSFLIRRNSARNLQIADCSPSNLSVQRRAMRFASYSPACREGHECGELPEQGQVDTLLPICRQTNAPTSPDKARLLKG